MPSYWNQKRKGVGRLCLAVAMVAGITLAIGACQAAVTGATSDGGSLAISIVTDTSRTLVPSLDMNVASYGISGIGPSGSTFSQTTTSANTTINGLAFGSWTVTVSVMNAAGTLIGQGTAPANVDTGKTTTVPLTVTPLPGTGTLSLTANWNTADVLVPQVSAQLLPSTGAAIPLPFTLGAGTASSQATGLATGYYTLTLQLLDSGYLVTGAVEVVRIVQGQTTSGTFDFTQANRALGSITVGITPIMSDPLAVALSGQSATIAAGSSMTVTAATTGYAGNVTYVWYMNGVSTATGSNASPGFTVGSALAAGVYRLDVTAVSADGARAGSATTTFRVQ